MRLYLSGNRAISKRTLSCLDELSRLRGQCWPAGLMLPKCGNKHPTVRSLQLAKGRPSELASPGSDDRLLVPRRGRKVRPVQGYKAIWP